MSLARLALAAIVLATGAGRADLLVLMHGSGRLERYDPLTGRHLGTVLAGLDRPNQLLVRPDRTGFVSTGDPGGPGSVIRVDLRGGRVTGPFASDPPGSPGHLARATGLAWWRGDLLAASQGDGTIKRYDGSTGAYRGEWRVASPGAITQIAVGDDRLYVTDFAGQSIRVLDLTAPDWVPTDWQTLPGHSPWGLVFDPAGTAFASTNAGQVLRLGGGPPTVRAEVGLKTPVALTLDADGRLYAANLHGSSVSVHAPRAAPGDPPVAVIGGPEMSEPIDVDWLEGRLEPPRQIGNFQLGPSNTGRDWQPGRTPVYNLKAAVDVALLTEFGFDTEGGDRAKTDLLREPVRLVFGLADGRLVDAATLPATAEFGERSVVYRLSPAPGCEVTWRVGFQGDALVMAVDADGELAGAELVVPLNPRAMGTCVIAERWGEMGQVFAPLIVNALDFGQLRLAADGDDPRLNCRYVGSRLHRRLDLTVQLLAAAVRSRTIRWTPVYLSKPRDELDQATWLRIRRGLLSLLQDSAYMPAHEDGSGFLGSPGGIIGNNVISDPVTCNLDRNLQWLAGMGPHAVVGGIDLRRVARRTIEFWLNHRMNADGSLDYVLQAGNISADSNTGILNAATDYYLSTGDREFVRANLVVLRRAADYLLARDLDGDALIETFRDGDGGREFGDTGYDTISSGWKNALVGGQAYKSLLGVAQMLDDAGEAAAADYRRRAVALRIAYNRTFYQPDQRRYLWWIGRGGRRHDYGNPLIQANAVIYGMADCLARDAGIDHGPREVMAQLWDDLAAAEYTDTAKGARVDYMDPARGEYPGLFWGIPCNLADVPDEFCFADFGSHEFPYYCNGGIFPQDTVATIVALRRAGLTAEAGLVQRAIFKRQHEGILPNGSGFYMGVVNESGRCYSILKWDGTPTDYEGIISRDCSFLQTAILEDDPARALFDQAAAMRP